MADSPLKVGARIVLSITEYRALKAAVEAQARPGRTITAPDRVRDMFVDLGRRYGFDYTLLWRTDDATHALVLDGPPLADP